MNEQTAELFDLLTLVNEQRESLAAKRESIKELPQSEQGAVITMRISSALATLDAMESQITVAGKLFASIGKGFGTVTTDAKISAGVKMLRGVSFCLSAVEFDAQMHLAKINSPQLDPTPGMLLGALLSGMQYFH